MEADSVCLSQWCQIGKPGFCETTNNRSIVYRIDVNRYITTAQTERSGVPGTGTG